MIKNALLIILLLALAAVSISFWLDQGRLTKSIENLQKQVSAYDGHGAKSPNSELQNCLVQAETEYNQKWNSLCNQSGQADFCKSFVGSPKDIQFTQIEGQQKALCISLYK